MNKIGDFNKIISDRNLFNQVVYTPLSDAIRLLEERQKDKELIKKIENLLGNDIPGPFKKLDKYGVSSKQVATPNCDTKWFIKLTKEFGLKPVFSEYHSDKFTSNNAFKHSLGVLHLSDGICKNGEPKLEKITVVDFKRYDGKSFKDVLTFWSEPLIDFHKRLFKIFGHSKDDLVFYDASDWLKRNGGSAKNYYKKETLLYVCHGILFENFLLTGKEGNFTKEIFLPAFEEVINLTGLKPLIVPIPPMDIEEDPSWIFYDNKIKKHIKLN